MTKLPATPLTLIEAGREAGLSPVTLRIQIRNGKLSGTKLGRDWIVSREELRRYLKHRGRRD